eukprot:s2142_g10.t1
MLLALSGGLNVRIMLYRVSSTSTCQVPCSCQTQGPGLLEGKPHGWTWADLFRRKGLLRMPQSPQKACLALMSKRMQGACSAVPSLSALAIFARSCMAQFLAPVVRSF